MKNNPILLFLIFSLCGLMGVSCTQSPKQTDAKNVKGAEVVLKDYGAEPAVLNIDEYTVSNNNFRTALWTGGKLQVTLMSIPVGGDVGLEQHMDTDQFLRIEDGTAKVLMGDSKDAIFFEKAVDKDFAIFIPAGKWHNIINTGNVPLKLYSIYAPVEHPHGTIHVTQKDAEAAELHE